MNNAPARCWSQSRGYQRCLYASGLLLMAAGAAHVVVFAFDPQPLAGPLGWRTPIEFGVSLGMTVVFLGWIVTWLPDRKVLGRAIAAGSTAASSVRWARRSASRRWQSPR